jgi:hypothetical protein
LYEQIRGQATTLAYLDTYWVLGAAAGVMFLAAFLLKKNRPGSGGSVAVH